MLSPRRLPSKLGNNSRRASFADPPPVAIFHDCHVLPNFGQLSAAACASAEPTGSVPSTVSPALFRLLLCGPKIRV